MDKLYRPFTLNGHPIFMDIPSPRWLNMQRTLCWRRRFPSWTTLPTCVRRWVPMWTGCAGHWFRSRIGNKFIYRVLGMEVCFQRCKALAYGRENGHTMRILEAVEAVNDDQKSVLFNKINAYFGGELRSKTVAFWGLSFKPNTDDMREARLSYWRTFCSKRARTWEHMIQSLWKKPSTIWAIPSPTARAIWVRFRVQMLWRWSPNGPSSACQLEKVGAAMKTKVVFDGRNLYRSAIVAEAGFDCYGIGIKWFVKINLSVMNNNSKLFWMH